MSYYLGKVGRAGARLMSSCKDLYYDVNAAYLTGAVDIVCVRQQDGSLKSTPFHVRFGKLGVLRTGDLKEVEIEVNGTPVSIPMKIDETGKAFFLQSKPTEEPTSPPGSLSVGGGGASHPPATSDLDQIAIGMAQVSLEDGPTTGISEDSIASGTTSLGPQITGSHDGHMTPSGQSDSNPPVQEETPTKIARSYSDGVIVFGSMQRPRPLEALLEREPSETTFLDRQCNGEDADEDGEGESEVEGEGEGPKDGEGYVPERSAPIAIQQPRPPGDVSAGTLASCRDVCCSLPTDLEVFSDSAVETAKKTRLEVSYGGGASGAVSDTEVDVQARLSSNLWTWSGTRQHTSQGVASQTVTTASSDDELRKRAQQQAQGDRSSIWSALTGILRRKSKRRRFSSVEDGIYLEDIDADMDPNKLSQFFPPSCAGGGAGEQLASSDLGSSPSLSPSHSTADLHKEAWPKLVSTLSDVALSLCGGLGQGSISEATFEQSLVSYEDFCAEPAGILANPNLVVRVNGKYYNWQVAAPMLMSAVLFLRTLPQSSQRQLERKYMHKKRSQSFWYFWGRNQSIDDEDGPAHALTKSEGGTPIGSPRKWMSEGERGGVRVGGAEVLSSDEEQTKKVAMPPRPRQRSLRRKKYMSTSLTSEQLASLPLHPGSNDIVFSITTKFQGTTQAHCTLYLWNYSDKIVVSDIDGTITRSDVAGQVLPLFGKDWTQNGVVELFNAIQRNGYRIVYLSARAIGQSWYTKEFLRGVRRGVAMLPDGPLFLAPFSLYTAFRKEVIEKKPEEFKIDCLKQIRALFPGAFNPLHAGFGNKLSDVKSYMSVEIPRSRTFTVNHKGHLKYEISCTFQSSYTGLVDFVDAQFPPVMEEKTDYEEPQSSEEYSSFNYWRPFISEQSFELPDFDSASQ